MSRSHTGRSKQRHRHHGDPDQQVSERTLSREQTRGLPLHGDILALPIPFAALSKNTVILARILQDDGVTTKARPCVVFDGGDDHVIVHPVTSSALAAGRLALEIDNWRESGLNRPSAVLHRHLGIDDHHDVLEVMGTLHASDARRLNDSLVTTVSAIPFDDFQPAGVLLSPSTAF